MNHDPGYCNARQLINADRHSVCQKKQNQKSPTSLKKLIEALVRCVSSIENN